MIASYAWMQLDLRNKSIYYLIIQLSLNFLNWLQSFKRGRFDHFIGRSIELDAAFWKTAKIFQWCQNYTSPYLIFLSFNFSVFKIFYFKVDIYPEELGNNTDDRCIEIQADLKSFSQQVLNYIFKINRYI